MEKNYYKQVVAFSNAPKEIVYKYDKCERLERCFVSTLSRFLLLSCAARRDGSHHYLGKMDYSQHDLMFLELEHRNQANLYINSIFFLQLVDWGTKKYEAGRVELFFSL